MQFDISEEGSKIVCHKAMYRNFEREIINWIVKKFWL